MKPAVSQTTLNSNYESWLMGQGVPIFRAADASWQLYKDALIPTPIGPFFTHISTIEARQLLKDSGVWFLRYSTDPCEEETEWWYIVCDKYAPELLSSKVRNQIRRGNKECVVKQIDAQWLAESGYKCYSAAYARYKNAAPASETEFRNNILKAVGGPIEYWGVFVDQELAGYCQCIVDGGEVATSVIKFDPVYLKHYTSYALVNNLADHYVVKRGMRLSNGNRAIAHDTNFQDLLIKLGFRKQYCRLIVIYRPWLKLVLQLLYPMRGLVSSLPDSKFILKLRSFFFQEELRRLCL